MRAKRSGRAQEGAGGADVGAERIEATVDLLGQLLAHAEIAIDHVGVVHLVGRVAAGLGHDLLGAGDHPGDERGGDALRARDQLDVGAEGPHGPDLLLGERIGRDDPQRIALDRADEGE